MATATDPSAQYLNQQMATGAKAFPIQTTPGASRIGGNVRGPQMMGPVLDQKTGVPTSSAGALDAANGGTGSAPGMQMPGTTPVSGTPQSGIGTNDNPFQQLQTNPVRAPTSNPNQPGLPGNNSPAPAVNNYVNQQAQQSQANNAAAQTAANGSLPNPNQPAYGNVTPPSAHLGTDPYINSALSNLQNIANGSNVPYSSTVKANMLSSASDMDAASETTQASQLRNQAAMNGGSLSDPSSQAAMRQLSAQRQGANATAKQGIDMQAGQANFAAQQAANNTIAQTRIGEANADPQGLGQVNGNGSAQPPQAPPPAPYNPGNPGLTQPTIPTAPVPVSPGGGGGGPLVWGGPGSGMGNQGAGKDGSSTTAPQQNPQLQADYQTMMNNSAGSGAANNAGTANNWFNANADSLRQQLGSGMTSADFLQNPNAYNQAAQAIINYDTSPAGIAAQQAQQAASAAGQAQNNAPGGQLQISDWQHASPATRQKWIASGIKPPAGHPEFGAGFDPHAGMKQNAQGQWYSSL